MKATNSPDEFEKCFKLFPNCIPVKGTVRSVIADLQYSSYKFIPNDLYYFLLEYEGKSKSEIYYQFKIHNHSVIDEYLDFLEKNEFIFWCYKSEVVNFPKFDLSWDESSEITNAIVDYDEHSNFSIVDTLNQLEYISCRDIQIRLFSPVSIDFLDGIFSQFLRSRMKSIQLITKYSDKISKNEWISFCKRHKRISLLFIHNSPKFEFIPSESGAGLIYYLEQKISTHLHCGNILPEDFTVNIKTFSESQKHNTCLNRKISIDTNGEIRNCPSMKESYGNIRDTKLAEALSKKGFKKYWNINKDKIAVCKDCEFRYICTDCRAYLRDPDDIHSKPLKCGYDPYTATWSDWSTNPLSKKGIEHYGLNDLVKKH